MALDQKQITDLLSMIGKKGSTKLPSLISGSQKQPTTLDDVRNDTLNLGTRLASAGVDVGATTDKRDMFEKALNLPDDQNLLFDFFEIINRPQQALFGGITALQEGADFGEGVSKGWSGKEDYYGGDILRNALGLENTTKDEDILTQMGDWTNWAGFALDIFLDPADLGLFLTTGGVGNVAKAGVETAQATGKVISKGAEVLKVVDNITDGIKGAETIGDMIEEGADVISTVKKATGAVDAVEPAKKLSESAQDLFLGKGRRFATNLTAEEYFKAITPFIGKKQRELSKVARTSFQDMAMKPMFAGFKLGTKMTDGALEASFATGDGTALKNYRALKTSITKSVTEKGASVKRAIIKAKHREKVVKDALKSLIEGFDTKLTTVATEMGMDKADVLIKTSRLHEWQKLSKDLTPIQFLHKTLSSPVPGLVPYEPDLIEAVRAFFGDDAVAGATEATYDGLKAIQFDIKYWNSDNFKELITKASGEDITKPLNSSDLKDFERAFMNTDPEAYKTYELTKQTYEAELEAQATKELQADIKQGKKYTDSKAIKRKNSIKNRIRSEDLARGDSPEYILRGRVDRSTVQESVYRRQGKDLAVKQLPDSTRKEYLDLRDFEDAEIVERAKQKYPAVTGEGKEAQDALRTRFISDERMDSINYKKSNELLEKAVKDSQAGIKAPDLTQFKSEQEVDDLVDAYKKDKNALKNYPETFKDKIKAIALVENEIDDIAKELGDKPKSVKYNNRVKKLTALQDDLYTNHITSWTKPVPVVVEAKVADVLPTKVEAPAYKPTQVAREAIDKYVDKAGAFLSKETKGLALRVIKGDPSALKEIENFSQPVKDAFAEYVVMEKKMLGKKSARGDGLSDPLNRAMLDLRDAILNDVEAYGTFTKPVSKAIVEEVAPKVDYELTQEAKDAGYKLNAKGEISDPIKSQLDDIAKSKATLKDRKFKGAKNEELAQLTAEIHNKTAKFFTKELGYSPEGALKLANMLDDVALLEKIFTEEALGRRLFDKLMEEGVHEQDILGLLSGDTWVQDFIAKYNNSKPWIKETFKQPSKDLGQNAVLAKRADLELIAKTFDDTDTYGILIGNNIDVGEDETKWFKEVDKLKNAILGSGKGEAVKITKTTVDTIERLMKSGSVYFEDVLNDLTPEQVKAFYDALHKIDMDFGTRLSFNEFVDNLGFDRDPLGRAVAPESASKLVKNPAQKIAKEVVEEAPNVIPTKSINTSSLKKFEQVVKPYNINEIRFIGQDGVGYSAKYHSDILNDLHVEYSDMTKGGFVTVIRGDTFVAHGSLSPQQLQIVEEVVRGNFKVYKDVNVEFYNTALKRFSSDEPVENVIAEIRKLSEEAGKVDTLAKPLEEVVAKADNYADELANTTSPDIEATIADPQGGGTFERTGANKGARKTYDDGYQVSFQTRTDGYSDEQINELADKLKKQYNATNVDLGVYHYDDGTVAKELSLHIPDETGALEIAKNYNQESVLKWTGGGEIDFIGNPDYLAPVAKADNVVDNVVAKTDNVLNDMDEPVDLLAKAPVKAPLRDYKASGKIKVGSYYTPEQMAEFAEDMKNPALMGIVNEYGDVYDKARRIAGQFEFEDPNALIRNSMEGYMTHTPTKEVSEIFKRLRKSKTFKNGSNLYASMFAPGKTANLRARMHWGSALEANNFSKAFYKEALLNDDWLKANIEGFEGSLGEEMMEQLEEFFETDLFSENARHSLDAFMNNTYTAINKNHKTQEMMLAMAIGNPDGINSAIRVTKSGEGIPTGFVGVDEVYIKRLKNTLLVNQEYAGKGAVTDKFIEALTKASKEGNAMVMEEHLYKKMEVFTERKPKDALDMLDSINKMFKLGKVSSPAFNVKNFIGNTFNMWVSGVDAPSIYKYWGKSIDAQKQMDVVYKKMIDQGFDALTDSEKSIYKVYEEFQNAGFLAKETVTALNDVPFLDEANKVKNSKGMNSVIYDNLLTRANMKLNKTVDDGSRLALYLYAKDNPQYLRNLGFDTGDIAKDAMDAVRFALFDPADLTFFEDDIMKRLIPFYTFTRQNMIFQMKNLAKNSDRYYKVFKAYNAWNSEFADISPEELQDYQRNQFYIPLFGKKDGDFFAIKTGLPMSAITELSLNPQDMLQQFTSMVTPALKVPIEGATGTQMLNGQPISRYEGEMSKNIPGFDKWQEWGLSQTGLDVPARGVGALIETLGGKGTAQTFNRGTGITANVNVQDNAVSKEYDKLNALEDKLKAVKASGVQVMTLAEINAKMQGTKNAEKTAGMKGILDMINNIKR